MGFGWLMAGKLSNKRKEETGGNSYYYENVSWLLLSKLSLLLC